MGFMPVVTRSFFVFSGENRGDIEVKRVTGRQDNERNMLLIMAHWHTGMGRGTIEQSDTPATPTTVILSMMLLCYYYNWTVIL